MAVEVRRTGGGQGFEQPAAVSADERDPVFGGADLDRGEVAADGALARDHQAQVVGVADRNRALSAILDEGRALVGPGDGELVWRLA